MGGENTPRLFRESGDDDEVARVTLLLEQYKLYVQGADTVSDRRIAASSHLLSINAALVAAYALRSPLTESIVAVFFLASAGMALSLLTHFIIRSFKDLNTVKFNIIHEFETRLPATPYTLEWTQAMERGKYQPMTGIELWMPWLFFVLHALALAVGVWAVVWDPPAWLVQP